MPHYCNFCGKEIPTRGGVKKHILARPDCRKKWDLLIRETDDLIDPAEKLVDTPTEEGLGVITNEPDFSYIDADSFSPLRRHHSESSSDPDGPEEQKRRRVTVEEVADEDNVYNKRYFEQSTEAGWPLREGQTGFKQYQQYKQEEGEDEWAPFDDAYVSKPQADLNVGRLTLASSEEWELAEWLIKNVGQKRTDDFLKLGMVSF